MSCLGISRWADITKWDFDSQYTVDPTTDKVIFERKKSYAETSGKFCKEMRTYAEYCDRLFQIFRGITEIGGWISITSLLSSASATLSAVRSVLTIEQLVSGDFIEKKKKTTMITNAEGQNEHLSEETIDWLGTVSNVCIAVGRFFSTAVWFAKAQIIKLGKHAKWVGGVATGAFAAGITFFTLQQGRDLVEEIEVARQIDKEQNRVEYEKQLWAVKKKFSWLMCGVADLIELPAGIVAHPLFAGITKVGAGCTWLLGQYLMADGT